MSSNHTFKVVAISGSLRKDSLNTALLRAVKSLAPASLEIELCTLENIPLYNEELEGKQVPQAVETLRRQVAEAQGMILSTPEYNRDMSGAMHNALDWLSRPVFEGAAHGKCCVALVATESTYHGMSAWEHVVRTLRHLSNHVVEPDLVMHTAHEQLAVDEDGNVHIQNEWSEEAIRILLKSLEDSIAAGLGQTTGHCCEGFWDALYKPRRGALEYPLKLRQLSK